MKQVLLSGYYGFGNAGDEAILEAVTQAFNKHQVAVSVLSQHPEQTYKTFGVKAYQRRSLKEILRGIRESDLVLSGGGGLFQDTTSVRSLIYYLRIPVIAKLLKKKTMIFGQGIGPLKTGRGKLLMRILGNRCFDRITVRDEKSAALLKSLGIKKRIEVTADLAFLLRLPAPEEIERTKHRFRLDSAQQNWLGITLRQWPGVETWLPKFADMLSEFSSEESITPVLIPFQINQDEWVLERLSQKLKIPHHCIMEPLSAKELLEIIANLNFIVGMRFHALVFAAKSSIPFLGIAYDPKVKSLCTELQSPILSLENFSAKAFKLQLQQAWKNRQESGNLLRERIPVFIQKAGRNIQAALELLEKK